MPHYHQLYTAKDTAVVFIHVQPKMLLGVASRNRAHLVYSIALLARAAKKFDVPAILTAMDDEDFSGDILPHLTEVFPERSPIKCRSMNSWDSQEFRKAVEATGRKNILLAGAWTECCITWPAIEMLGTGYNIYVVEDCCGATSHVAQKAALSRIVQAGGTRVSSVGALMELKRDWKGGSENDDALRDLFRWHSFAYGMDAEKGGSCGCC